MTFQFKVRAKQNVHEECQKQINLLRECNRALEKQNESRNQQRKALQVQIQRLTRLQSEWKLKGLVSTHTISINDNKDYIELKQQHHEIKAKYQKLLLENSSLTTRIISAELNNSRLITYENQKKSLNQTITSHTTKISLLESKIISYEKEIFELKNKQNSHPTIIRQYTTTINNSKIQDLQRQLRQRNDRIALLQREAGAKEEQLSHLKRQIANYSLKIDSLSQQLTKIQRTQKVQIRYVERQQTLALRSKLEQLSNINSSLAMELNSLQVERGNNLLRIKDLQKRIMILQESNYNLKNDLNQGIQAPRQHQDHNLKQAVYSLKQELNEVRAFNQLVRQENDGLYEQIQIYKSNYCRCNHKSHHRKSRSPIKTQLESKLQYKVSQPKSALQKLGHNHSNLSMPVSDQRKSQHAILHSHQGHVIYESKLVSDNKREHISERYNDLQRKIQQLQNENQVLKKHLVHQI